MVCDGLGGEWPTRAAVAVSPNDAVRPQQRWGMVLKRAEQSMLQAKASALKPSGLTVAQYVALDTLQAEPGITAASLARACLITPQAILVVLNALDERGLVSRRSHPRHPTVLELRLTDVGEEALHGARKLVLPVERRLDEALPEPDRRKLTDLLGRVIDASESV